MQIAAMIATRLTGKSHSIEDMHLKWEVPFSEQVKVMSEEEKQKLAKEISDRKRAELSVFSQPRRKK